jgi:hypothetical protein
MHLRTVIRLVRLRGGQVTSIIQAGRSVREFRGGQYANTSDGFTGFIYADNGGHYQVAICEHDEERRCSASELTPWTPKNGDRVVEADNDDSPIGTVVEAGEEISLVVWKGLMRQVSFVNSCLEPAWSD